ncbi:MAG: extracellular solute-binding protein [Gammaproteobacteria bacterium]|nr:extracellular solute-binding protein [Gammaproteobacteria bacterium]MDH5651579.1 extracellular solute-binding protein [Gammaproteobacteria bacterium]
MQRCSLILLIGLSMLGSTASAEEELLVYSGRKPKFIQPVIDEFTRTTGIKVKLQSGNSSYLLNLLSMQHESTDVDVYISNDAGNLERGNSLELFQALPDRLVSSVPANLRGMNNHWVGLSGRSRVLVVNSQSPLANSISSIQDLAKPQLKNRLGLTNSENESFIAGVTVYMRSLGEQKMMQWLKAVKDNTGGKVYKKHSDIVDVVAKGEKDVGLVNHYYVYHYLKKHPSAPIKIILPDHKASDMGVAWNVSGVAISRYTKQTPAAVKFLEFLLSVKGQEMFSHVNLEYPVRNDVAVSKGIPERSSYHIANIKMADIGLYREQTIKMFHLISMP